MVLMEMSTKNLIRGGAVDAADFLGRIEMLNSVGQTVLVTDFPEYYRLAEFIRRYTQEPCAISLSVNHLRELFEDKYYEKLEGGILEGLGRLFKTNFTFCVYPVQDPASGLVTAETFVPQAPLDDIYRYLRRKEFVVDVQSYDPSCLPIYSSDVARLIQQKNESWKKMVPPPVAELIKRRNLFGV